MDSVLTKVYALIILCFMFSLSGCGRAYFTDTRLLSGNVSTSTGNFPITKSEESRWQFRSSFEEAAIIIVPFRKRNMNPSSGSLEFWLPGNAKNYTTFKPASAFYQINNEPKVPIELICNLHSTRSNGNTNISCNYPLPKILISASYNQPAEGLLPRAEVAIKSSIKDTYRFMMAFKYDDRPIRVDFKFKLKLKTKLHLGIPGGSP